MARNYSLNKTKFFSTDEVLALERMLVKYQDKYIGPILMIQLALKTGARRGELFAIEKCHLNESDASVFIQGIKGSNDREIPLEREFFARLWAYATSHDSHLLFNFKTKGLEYHWYMFRPVKKSFHGLRHTAGIRLYDKTRDIRLVKYFLGHACIRNTMIYLDYSYSQEELRLALLDEKRTKV